MSELLTYSEAFLRAQNAHWTAKEIQQQPQIWRDAAANVDSERAQLTQWLTPILAKTNVRIILTGAGTSAYVGDAIAPHLSEGASRVFEAISTTNIVSNPKQYLLKNVPTLLVSYGRSGNSPESVATVDLASAVVDECYHLVLTCNPDGELAQCAKGKDNFYSLLMPEGTLDQSFAMTSSFTSMLVSTVAIFQPNNEQVEIAAQWTENLLKNSVEQIKEIARRPTERLVFLGAGGLEGIAREAALKVLELTAGQVLSYCESPLGFRHGPKSLMDSSTEVVFLSSSHTYTRQYDQDLLSELHRDKQALAITTLNKNTFGHPIDIDDVWAGLPYIVYCQLLAFFKSMHAGLTPDNPCPTGEVNRVVQGVTLYPIQID